MENSFTEQLRKLSDVEVQYYINHRNKFQEKAVQAAIWELERRGKSFETLADAQKELNDKRESLEEETIRALGIPISTVPHVFRIAHFLVDLFIILLLTLLILCIPYIEFGKFFLFILYPFYCIYFEYYFQKTPGKFFTNAIVVDKYGEKPDLETILLRTALRYLPLEIFSCLGYYSWGWHDRLSKTYVILEADLPKLREKSGLDKTTGELYVK